MLKRLWQNIGAARAGRTGADSTIVVANPLRAFAEKNTDGRLMDKWVHYFDIYHRHFNRFRGQAITMVEIGVFNGGSLRMWRDYFGTTSTIVGVDINAECARYAEPGVQIVIGDQSDRGFLGELRARFPSISALVDDGGHHMHQQITTFEEMYPHLTSDGVYLCEDVHTSYHTHFGGKLGQADTFVERTKTMIDRLNAWHIPGAALPPDEFTRTTDSLHFYSGVVVIERHAQQAPLERAYGTMRDFRYVAPSLAGRLYAPH